MAAGHTVSDHRVDHKVVGRKAAERTDTGHKVLGRRVGHRVADPDRKAGWARHRAGPGKAAVEMPSEPDIVVAGIVVVVDMAAGIAVARQKASAEPVPAGTPAAPDRPAAEPAVQKTVLLIEGIPVVNPRTDRD